MTMDMYNGFGGDDTLSSFAEVDLAKNPSTFKHGPFPNLNDLPSSLAQYDFPNNPATTACTMMPDVDLSSTTFCTTMCAPPPACMECYECYLDKVRFNSAYILPLGFIRFLILVTNAAFTFSSKHLCLLGGSFAAWAIPMDVGLFYDMGGGFGSTRDGYLVVAGVAFGLSLLFFLLSIMNFPSLAGIDPLHWIIFFNFWDFIMLLALLGISITAAVREAQVSSFDFIDTVWPRAFAAAGTLGLIAVVLLATHIAATIPIYLAFYKCRKCAAQCECVQVSH